MGNLYIRATNDKIILITQVQALGEVGDSCRVKMKETEIVFFLIVILFAAQTSSFKAYDCRGGLGKNFLINLCETLLQNYLWDSTSNKSIYEWPK